MSTFHIISYHVMYSEAKQPNGHTGVINCGNARYDTLDDVMSGLYNEIVPKHNLHYLHCTCVTMQVAHFSGMTRQGEHCWTILHFDTSESKENWVNVYYGQTPVQTQLFSEKDLLHVLCENDTAPL